MTAGFGEDSVTFLMFIRATYFDQNVCCPYYVVVLLLIMMHFWFGKFNEGQNKTVESWKIVVFPF